MSYKLGLSIGFGNVYLYDFQGVYKCVIMLSNGQFILIDVNTLFTTLLQSPPESAPIYYTDGSSFIGNFLCLQNNPESASLVIKDFTTRERFELNTSNALTNNEYDKVYRFGSTAVPHVYSTRSVTHNKSLSPNASEDGDLIVGIHGYTGSPAIGQYSVATKQWKYQIDHCDEEYDRVITRKKGEQFTFALTPASIFDGKYIIATTTAADGSSMLHDDLLAIIIASGLLPPIVGGSGVSVREARLYIHESDSKINQGTPSLYQRVFYRCYYSGEDRWCFADLNNIIAALILISDTDSPYEAIYSGASFLSHFSAFTSLSAVPYTCVPVYQYGEPGFWPAGIMYAFGASQVNRYLMIGTYEGVLGNFYAYYVDRETGVLLHPDLIDRWNFHHPTMGIITREDFYFENTRQRVTYVCNFHNQFGYDNNETWMSFIQDYQGNWVFPRADHALQPYGSKFELADFTPYDPILNPTGYVIRALNNNDTKGSVLAIDTTDEDNYTEIDGIDYLNVDDKIFLSINLNSAQNDIISMDLVMFNDINLVCPRPYLLDNIRAVYTDSSNIFEINNIVISAGSRYAPIQIYNLLDFTQYISIVCPLSTEVTLLINQRWLITGGYPGNIYILDLINGLNTSDFNSVICSTNVKDIAYMSWTNNILYWTAQHRRMPSYYGGLVFGVVSWSDYILNGTLSSTQPDCAYDINVLYSVDIRVNQLGLVLNTYSDVDVEAAVVDWIANYKVPGETDDEARDRLITILKGTCQFKQYGLYNDGNYLFIGLYWQGNYCMSGCNFEDSLGVLHTYNEDTASQYPTVKVVDISGITALSQFDDKSIYHNVEIQGPEWLGVRHFGRLVGCGDYLLFFPTWSQNLTDIFPEFDGTYWCAPIYVIAKSDLISGIPAGFISSALVNKILIPVATTEAAAKEAWGQFSSYEYRKMDSYADSESGEIYASVNNDISYLNGLGETVIPCVVKINPATLTYTFVCGSDENLYNNFEGFVPALSLSYNSTKDVLWVVYGLTSSRLTNASTASMALLT